VRVLGLDPGTERTGYGCIESCDDRLQLVASGVLRLGRGALGGRLAHLHAAVLDLLDTHRPQACAIEGIFHQHHARSALVLGHARGVCLLAAAEREIPVVEYAPAAVKRVVTGNGAADKQQVEGMVARLLGSAPGATFDESDAIAIALCHVQSARVLRVFE
jgi:crossover junction endodeoxyribonuclease RuvC